MPASAERIVRRILSEHPKKRLTDSSLTPGAVTLLLYSKDGEYCVLLNKRTEEVEHHKGEISFPGGQRDEADRTLLDTALRETHEEMGIRPEDIDVLGELDDVPTSSRFLISTYVGAIPHPYGFKPNEDEVADVLEVPISALMDDDNVRGETRIVGSELVSAPSYAYNGHLIFGATARILKRFLQLLRTAGPEEAHWWKKKPQP